MFFFLVFVYVFGFISVLVILVLKNKNDKCFLANQLSSNIFFILFLIVLVNNNNIGWLHYMPSSFIFHKFNFKCIFSLL